jgi:hypothetical protein
MDRPAGAIKDFLEAMAILREGAQASPSLLALMLKSGMAILEMAEGKGQMGQEEMQKLSSMRSNLPRADWLELLECLAAALGAGKS